MRLTLPLSRDFRPGAISDPEHSGGVDWTQFNTHLERLLGSDWRRVNDGTSYSVLHRWVRLALAYGQQRRNTILDFRGKLRIFSQMRIPPDPNIVFFGAEAGWEAALIQALYGGRGRVVLIDRDPVAYQRFVNAPESVRVRSRPGWKCWKTKWVEIHRNPSRIEYLRQDFFELEPEPAFDVGIDWGLVEHFDDAGKRSVLDLFGRFLKPNGIQISSCPRDCVSVRAFYRAFADELNFGYRELMTRRELTGHLQHAGYRVEESFTLAGHHVVASRKARVPIGFGSPGKVSSTGHYSDSESIV